MITSRTNYLSCQHVCSVRPEEYDWAIYHVIDEKSGCSMDEICERTGYEPGIVQESLGRLISSLLINIRGEKYRICSIEEMLIAGQMKRDPFSDIIIENGVVKVRTPPASDHSNTHLEERE